MGGAKGKRKPRAGNRAATDDRWRRLTWRELTAWAGSRTVERGRAYQRQGAVQDLAISPDGAMLASVQGTRQYVTTVWWEQGGQADQALHSRCTCPIGLRCKHAVAVVADYLQALADKTGVPTADPNDRRWKKLSSNDLNEWSMDEDDPSFDLGGDGVAWRPPKRHDEAGKAADEKIRRDLAGRSHEELVEWIMSLADRLPELHRELHERVMLSEGDVDHLVRDTEREIDEVTAEPGWWNPWQREGRIPDFSRLKQRLQRLVEHGQADAVVDLGRELLERGIEQVGQSDDEGETAMALGDCLDVVFEGVARSTLSGPQKLLFAIDAHLHDDFDVIGDASEQVLEMDYSATDWSDVADELYRCLDTKPSPKMDRKDFHQRYEREQIARWLAMALDRADRRDEVSTLLVREARATGSYEQLVRFLLEQKRYDEARRWAQEGIEQTRKQWPGTASALAGLLAEQARQRKQWGAVAAHAAWKFFDYPSPQSYDELINVAGKARCQRKVRKHALNFLETGRPPIQLKTTAEQDPQVCTDPDWPLPVPEYLIRLMRQPDDEQPHCDVLLELALAAKRPRDVLRWYDKLTAQNGKTQRYSVGHAYADRVAEAVARSHPQRALAIHQDRLETNLEQANRSAYEACADCLRKMRPIMKKLGQERQWKQKISRIREDYRRRPRFMEILDEIEGQTIVRSHQNRRRKT